MKSNLSKDEFKQRLAELTAKEKSFYFFTSYNPSGPPFYGTYDDNTFKLSRNTFWRNAKALEITGEYNDFDGASTEVTWQIGLPKFTRIFSIVIGSFFFLILNIISILESHEAIGSVIMTLIGILLVAFGWVIDRITKKIVDQRFREEFEIGVEDEWERLAASINK